MDIFWTTNELLLLSSITSYKRRNSLPQENGPFLLAAFLCRAFNLFLPPICPQWQNLRMPAAQTHLYRSISIPFRMRYRVEFKLCLLPFSGPSKYALVCRRQLRHFRIRTQVFLIRNKCTYNLPIPLDQFFIANRLSKHQTFFQV